MPKLSDVISGLLGDVARADAAVRSAGRSSLKAQPDAGDTPPVMSVSLPRITGVNFTLRFALGEQAQKDEAAALNPAIGRSVQREMLEAVRKSGGAKPEVIERFAPAVSEEAIRTLIQRSDAGPLQKDFGASLKEWVKTTRARVDIATLVKDLGTRLQALVPRYRQTQTIFAASTRELDVLVSRDEIAGVDTEKLSTLTMSVEVEELQTIAEVDSSTETKP